MVTHTKVVIVRGDAPEALAWVLGSLDVGENANIEFRTNERDDYGEYFITFNEVEIIDLHDEPPEIVEAISFPKNN